jgi:hypothetical protein
MKEISADLVKAQKEFGPALKTHTNPAFRSKYANLSACVEAVVDALNNNNIFLMQPTHPCDDGVIVETVFIHSSGEQISSGKLHVPATKHDAQGYGSALTYARRYSLMSACGIAPEDDDGNAAARFKVVVKPEVKPEPKPESKPKPIPEVMEGKEGDWQLKVTRKPEGDPNDWVEIVLEAVDMQLGQAGSEGDVMSIFKKNREIFDQLKLQSEAQYTALMNVFKKTKAKFKEQA